MTTAASTQFDPPEVAAAAAGKYILGSGLSWVEVQRQVEAALVTTNAAPLSEGGEEPPRGGLEVLSQPDHQEFYLS